MATPSASRSAAWALPLLNLLALLLFFSLDVRDFYFKAVWLGSSNSFDFHAHGASTYEATPLVPSPALNVSTLTVGDDVDFTSGWPSLLAKCDELYAPDGFFLGVRATNCLLGFPAKQIKANDLFLTASVRVDSVAWTACKLLYLHRRPPICQENIVTEFFHRYRLSDPILATDAMAEPNSDAENELRGLLDLIGRSYPLTDVVCFEGVQYGGPGEYPISTVFGCASPNVYDTAFVGLYAPHFAELHQDKMYLTVDVLNIMGFEFVIRQNCRSSFHITSSTSNSSGFHTNGRFTVDHRTTINFSSFGHLYILMIAIDLVLLAAHTRSALETANVLLLPLVGTHDPEEIKRLTAEYPWTLLYRSLYRSPPIAILTVLSVLLSWQMQMPNSIIWTWNQGSSGKLHAILSSIRVWMLVLCLLHQLWSLAVLVSETRAYQIAKRTFVSTWEVLVIGVIVAIAEQGRTFEMSNKKYALENQRHWDNTSFVNHTGYANIFNEELDYLLSTTTAVLATMYSPLLIVVSETLLVIGLYLGLKLVYFFIRRPTETLIDNEADSDTAATTTYKRLPLEELLRVPVRAQSLVRSTFTMELVAQQQLYIPPSVYFDFGVILDNDIIRTRRGFLNVIHLKVDVAKYFSPAAGGSVASVSNLPPVQTGSTTPNGRRPSSFFGVAAATSPSATRPPLAVQSPLQRSMSNKALQDAVNETDGVSSSNSSSRGTDDGTKGRRPLAETAGSPASLSMRRRKSISELPGLEDGF